MTQKEFQKKFGGKIKNGWLVFIGDLWCSNNQLTSLPDNLKVRGNLYCYNNQLTSLPDNLNVSGSLDCSYNNQLTSLPENLTVGGYLYCSYSKLNPNDFKFDDNKLIAFYKYVLTPLKLLKQIYNKTLSAKEAIKIKNTEIRMIAIKGLGTKKILDELGSVVIDKHKFNYGTDYLLELKDFKDSVGDAYKILKGYDPAENDYVYIRVSPECKTVIEAQNFIYQLHKIEINYNPISRT